MLLDAIDGYVARPSLGAPGERPPVLRDGYDADAVTSWTWRAGVTTLIWGGRLRFRLRSGEAAGDRRIWLPAQQRGVTAYPGLYFVGLPWLHTQQSGLLMGVSDDAALIASQIVNG